MIAKILGAALCVVLLPTTLGQCGCAQGSIGLDLTLLVDVDSASLANPYNGLQPLDFAKNFLKQLLFNYGMDISSNDQTGVRVAVFGVNATGAYPTKATLYTAGQPNTPDTVRYAIDSLSPDSSYDPSVDIDAGFLQAQNLFNKNTLGQRQNIPNVIITISSSTTSTAALDDGRVLRNRFGTLMIGIAVSLSNNGLDYTDISSPNAAFQVRSLNPNGFDSIIGQVLSLMCIAEGFCGGPAGGSTIYPQTSPTTSNPGVATQHSKCHNGTDAYPKLWLDVVLLIDNSAAQTQLNFDAMIEQIKEIWQPGQGGPVVSQGTARTRVAVVTFDTTANITAQLKDLNTNDDLMNVLSNIKQTSAVTVDGSNALQKAGSLFGTTSAAIANGDRQNAPNVIIIYAADWAGNDPCQIAESIQQHSVVLAVTVKNRNENFPSIQKCVYSPGEIYQSSNLNLDILTLESLAFANCFCIGQNLPGNHGGSMRQKTSRADHAVWYQFWNPRQVDNSYYLRDKWAECVQETTSTSSNHDTSLKSCHDDQNFLPNEFSVPKHTFLLATASVGNILTQWVGLQYDPNFGQWYWDGFDPITNQPTRTPMSPNDYTNWNPGQPNISGSQYCVREAPGTNGATGFKWYTVQCTGFQLVYHSQYLCQRIACDAFNYCVDY